LRSSEFIERKNVAETELQKINPFIPDLLLAYPFKKGVS